ncbi:PREDICTED: uncharacterized protein LOC105853558 isoform X2 [Condylura cristata]|uniref:uncharacterized protein LOC105853558 isoform X2 n=1 Tax=Condylura cristata TaxID=143302 RepID=UPI00064292FA|nr:PREDICTED: uncharacterized protein LOC105853558 isoform X2 [Condylura cristata]
MALGRGGSWRRLWRLRAEEVRGPAGPAWPRSWMEEAAAGAWHIWVSLGPLSPALCGQFCNRGAGGGDGEPSMCPPWGPGLTEHGRARGGAADLWRARPGLEARRGDRLRGGLDSEFWDNSVGSQGALGKDALTGFAKIHAEVMSSGWTREVQGSGGRRRGSWGPVQGAGELTWGHCREVARDVLGQEDPVGARTPLPWLWAARASDRSGSSWRVESGLEMELPSKAGLRLRQPLPWETRGRGASQVEGRRLGKNEARGSAGGGCGGAGRVVRPWDRAAVPTAASEDVRTLWLPWERRAGPEETRGGRACRPGRRAHPAETPLWEAALVLPPAPVSSRKASRDGGLAAPMPSHAEVSNSASEGFLGLGCF